MADIYHSDSLDAKTIGMIEKQFSKELKGCKRIAIKIHFGEPGNSTALNPDEINPIAELLTRMGISFFLYDSSVSYTSKRSKPETHKKYAIEKGWGKIGEVRTDDESVDVRMKNMSYSVCRPLAEADAVLVVTHVKGHVCSGFGGAIKNLGMGALSKESKQAIHDGAKPEYTGGCVQCGECVRTCPVDAVKLTDRPHFKGCYGCSDCIYSCPQHALKPRVNYFDVLLAEGAAAAHKSFRKSYYISFVRNITKECDCMKNPGRAIAPDCGAIFGNDIVAIDQAAYDLIFRKAGEDVFLKQNKKSGTQQIDAAEKEGMGSRKYRLIEA